MYTYYNDYMIDYFDNIDFSKLYAEFIELCYEKYSTDKKYLMLFVFLMSISRNLNYSDNLVVDLFKTIREYIFRKLNVEYKELIHDNVVLFSLWCEYTKKEEYIGGKSDNSANYCKGYRFGPNKAIFVVSNTNLRQKAINTFKSWIDDNPTREIYSSYNVEAIVNKLKEGISDNYIIYYLCWNGNNVEITKVENNDLNVAIKDVIKKVYQEDLINEYHIGLYDAIYVFSKSCKVDRESLSNIYKKWRKDHTQWKILETYEIQNIVDKLLKNINDDFCVVHVYQAGKNQNITLVNIENPNKDILSERIGDIVNHVQKSTKKSTNSQVVPQQPTTSQSKIKIKTKSDKIDKNVGHPKLSAFQALLIIHLISQHYYNINLVSTQDINLQTINQMSFYEMLKNDKKYRLNLSYFFIKKIYGRNTFVQFLFVDIYRIMYKAYFRLFTTAMFIMMTNVNRKNEISEFDKDIIRNIISKNYITDYDKKVIINIMRRNEIADSDKKVINDILHKNEITDADKKVVDAILRKNEITNYDKNEISDVLSKNVINFILNPDKIENKAYLLYKLGLHDSKEYSLNSIDMKKLSDAINWDLLCEYDMNNDDFD